MELSQNNPISTSLKNQFESCMVMLQKLIDIMLPDMWQSDNNGIPVWQQVYHVVYFIDNWFRYTYVRKQKDHFVGDFSLSPDLDKPLPESEVISQSDMNDYLKKIHCKTVAVFNNMTDEKLGKPIIDGGSKEYTHMDVTVGQIRHIMYNIGSLNRLLRDKGLPESDWYAYNE